MCIRDSKKKKKIAVSKMGVTGLIFVDPGAKVNGQYYRDVLLSRQMLPAIKSFVGDTLIFQQDSASAHRARETIQLLQRETPTSSLLICGHRTVQT